MSKASYKLMFYSSFKWLKPHIDMHHLPLQTYRQRVQQGPNYR